MEGWQDQALVLSARPHGEGGAVVSLFTEEHGQHAGYVHGGQSSGKRSLLQPGNLLSAEWQARTHEQLGAFKLEMQQQFSSLIMDDAYKLAALKSACALCDEGLPERESHTDFFHTTLALFTILAHSEHALSHWGETYIKWEITFLRELGFPLDLSRCAGGGDARTLAYVSPKSGCAVSTLAGEPYKDKLLSLPAFLKPHGGLCDQGEVMTGLKMTGKFLEQWAFAHHTRGVPEARLRWHEMITNH